MKITIPKVASQAESQINATANSSKRTVSATVIAKNATVNSENLIKRLIEKATVRGEKLTANRISILRLMTENPYITKEEMAAITSLNASTIMLNIKNNVSSTNYKCL